MPPHRSGPNLWVGEQGVRYYHAPAQERAELVSLAYADQRWRAPRTGAGRTIDWGWAGGLR